MLSFQIYLVFFAWQCAWGRANGRIYQSTKLESCKLTETFAHDSSMALAQAEAQLDLLRRELEDLKAHAASTIDASNDQLHIMVCLSTSSPVMYCFFTNSHGLCRSIPEAMPGRWIRAELRQGTKQRWSTSCCGCSRFVIWLILTLINRSQSCCWNKKCWAARAAWCHSSDGCCRRGNVRCCWAGARTKSARDGQSQGRGALSKIAPQKLIPLRFSFFSLCIIY